MIKKLTKATLILLSCSGISFAADNLDRKLHGVGITTKKQGFVKNLEMGRELRLSIINIDPNWQSNFSESDDDFVEKENGKLLLKNKELSQFLGNMNVETVGAQRRDEVSDQQRYTIGGTAIRSVNSIIKKAVADITSGEIKNTFICIAALERMNKKEFKVNGAVPENDNVTFTVDDKKVTTFTGYDTCNKSTTLSIEALENVYKKILSNYTWANDVTTEEVALILQAVEDAKKQSVNDLKWVVDTYREKNGQLSTPVVMSILEENGSLKDFTK